MNNLKTIWILSIYPEYFTPFLEIGVVGKFFSKKTENSIQVKVLNIRDYALDKHHSVDSYPCGGGAGMVMRADVLENAFLKGVVENGGYSSDYSKELLTIFMSPAGNVLTQKHVKKLKAEFDQRDLVIFCGRFEGIDQRFINQYIEREVSIGDYILSGGELGAMVLLDSLMRLVTGVLGNKDTLKEESFNNPNLLEHPHYTKPIDFNGEKVPEVLLSGHHQKIKEYKERESLKMTQVRRPKLYENYLRNKK